MALRTVKIVNSKAKEGYAIINESDFNPKKDKLFNETSSKPKAKAKAKAKAKPKAKAKK